MATLQPGSVQTLYFPIDGTLAFTITSPGRVSLNARNPDGAFLAPREIYATETLDVAAGSTVSFESFTVAVDYTQTLSGVAASSSGGGGGGLGANDLTAITTEADPINGGFSLATAQQSGVASALTYNGSGDIAAVTIDLPTTDIVSTYNYTDSLPYISGNWYVGGGLRMSAEQASEFKTNLVAAGANAAGFRIFVHDLAQGVTLEWNATAQSYRGINGSPILLSDDRTSGTNLLANTSETAAQKTVTIPGWLTAPNSTFHVEAHTTSSATAGHQLNNRIKFGGTTVVDTSTTTALTIPQRVIVHNVASKSAQKFWPAGATDSVYTGGNASTGVFTTATINTGNDTNVTIHHQVNTFTVDTAVVTFFRVIVQNP